MTKIFTLVMFVVVAIYDVYAMIVGGTENSISHLMITWAYKYPIFPFVMGILCGHLFWRMHDTKATKSISEFIDKE
jgi:hypothetical protein